MKNIKELQEERTRLKTDLIEIEKEICRHPEYIRQQFCHNPLWNMERFESLISRVEFARKLTAIPDGNYPEVWHPFVYQIDGRVYNVKFSESSLHPTSDPWEHHEHDGKMADDIWNADDPIEWLDDHSVVDEHKQIGYLLYLTLREPSKESE